MPKIRQNEHYEFGGPIGALLVMCTLPIVIYFLFLSANKQFIVPGVDITTLKNISIPPFEEYFSKTGFLLFIGWFFFQVILERILPGRIVPGVKLENGQQLKYKINGHKSFWVSMLVILPFSPLSRLFGLNLQYSVSSLYNNYFQLITASIIFSFCLSIFLFLKSFAKGALLAKGGNTGNIIYDFFIGRELNPRIGSLDLKFFCELRPGLIGWIVINFGMMAKQYENLGYISYSMILINIFQGVYVWDALYQEKAILTTMDITTDGFGFMLVFGDLAWVPFTYSLQARTLVDYDPNLPLWGCGLIILLNFLGYSIFRGANGQKDDFRRDPNSPTVAHLKYMNTERGTKLLISGYWGMARKINYTGDWLMGLSWCLLCGFGSIIPYFYAIYFGVFIDS